MTDQEYQRELAQQMRDSDTIFTAVSTSGARDYKEAERMVVLFYVPSTEISRAGISHALKRLKQFYEEK
jgi:hypothetical protein